MKKYKIFLASSAELSMERKEIALMISRLNNAWVEKDLYLELVIWEDLLHSFRGGGERIQDYFNREMLKCDIVMVLFFKKVGQFTEEEFKLAYDHLKKGKKPHFLFVYFKKAQIDIDDADAEDILKRAGLKKEIQQYEQIYGSFNSIEDLTQKFRHQLDLAILEKVGKPGWKDEAENLEKRQNDLENYNQYVKQKFQYLDFTGLNAILQKPLKLESVYVKLRAQKYLPFAGAQSIGEFERLREKKVSKSIVESILTEKVPKMYRVIPLRGIVESETSGEDFAVVFKRQLETSRKEGCLPRMLIVGHPGSGKTTLMKWIALQCGGKSDGDTTFSGYTPVFIPLRELGNDPVGTFRKKNIGGMVTHLMERENVSVDSFLAHHLKTNRLLFLMDGLDEIGDEKVRREVIDWIQKQYTGQNPVIVTSRFSGIHEKSGLKFRDDIPVFAVRDFEMEDVETFLKNWYRSIEIAVAGEEGTQKAIEKGDKKSEDLIHTVKNSENLTELGVNPLLLTIIAVVHRTRAVLPRDRFKLYEECLKVMFELWNLSNRKVDISFSLENSIAHLSNIAVRLMDTDRREMDKKEIEECCLPPVIEGQTRDFFLKEIVLKAGLLYESEGKYGFLHLTFQEYLAARYFADGKNQNSILKYHDKDYWKETFKLFVNIGNAEIFFEEIIEYFVTKKYWNQIEFWEDCVEEIVVEQVKESIELNFARKVIEILGRFESKKEDEELIEKMIWHWPLYTHGEQLVKEGWDLFNNAPHPFVQSVGSSILNRADDKNRAKLAEQLKRRINEFEKQNDESEKTLLFFLLQNNNSLSLLWEGRKKLTDFNFVLAKLKSKKTFLQYSSFLYFEYLRELREFWGLMKLLDISSLDYLGLPIFLNYQDLRYFLNLWDFLNLRALLDLRVLRNFLNFTYFSTFSETLAQYNKKYKSILIKHRHKIVQWTDRAMEKLHDMPDEELLKYFPNTTEEELNEFRESYGKVTFNGKSNETKRDTGFIRY